MPSERHAAAGLAASLGFDVGPSVWWEAHASEADADAAGDEPFFLQRPFVEEACADLAWSAELAEALLDGLAHLREEPALARLAWHMHWALFRATPPDALFDGADWPLPSRERLDRQGLFYAYVLLSGLGVLRERYAARGISWDIARRTLADLELWARTHHAQTGIWAVLLPGWLLLHFSGRLFQCGRLQYRLMPFPHDFHFIRHVDTSELRILAGAGMRFRKKGLGTIVDAEEGFTSQYEVREHELVVHVVDTTTGVVDPQPRSLARAEWREVLALGDPVLEIHLPAGPAPNFQTESAQSLRAAEQLFASAFPEVPFRGFYDVFWTVPLMPWFVSYIREFLLFASPSGSLHGPAERRVVPALVQRVRAHVEPTRVRRADGRPWLAAEGILLREELVHFGMKSPRRPHAA